MYNEDNNELFAGARSRDIWIRGLVMLLFLAVLWFIRLIVLILAAFQFVFAVVTGGPNQRLLPFGRSIATYMQQMVAFVSWNTETRPYPFSPWPTDGMPFADDDPVAAASPAPSSNWDDEPLEPEPEKTAPPPEPMAEEAPSPEPMAGDEPPAPPKPKSGGAKGKKKKKPSGRKSTSKDADFAGDEVP